MRTLVITTLLSIIGAAGLAAQEVGATATLMSPDGEEVGTAEFIQTPAHGVLIRLTARGLEPGSHGFHIHEAGRCEGDFSSAGGHYNPAGTNHGQLDPGGHHAGDMLNLQVPESGMVQAERLNEAVSLEAGAAGALFDEDGSALVIHGGADDYRSQPSGAAGPRVACGVIQPAG